jgi:hypothetical protein
MTSGSGTSLSPPPPTIKARKASWGSTSACAKPGRSPCQVPAARRAWPRCSLAWSALAGHRPIGASSSPRVAQPRLAASDQRQRNRNRPDRARETVAERDQRALQRHPARRMPERRVVLLAPRGPRHHRKLATPSQRGEAPLKPSSPRSLTPQEFPRQYLALPNREALLQHWTANGHDFSRHPRS